MRSLYARLRGSLSFILVGECGPLFFRCFACMFIFLEPVMIDSMFSLFADTPSDNYWKDLAEERKAALNDTLEENKSVCQLL